MKLLPVIVVLVTLVFTQCRSTRNSINGENFSETTIVKEGFTDCFEKGLKQNGQPVWCEASAILYEVENIWDVIYEQLPKSN